MANPVITWRVLIERARAVRIAEGVSPQTLSVELSSLRKFVRLLGKDEADPVDEGAIFGRNALVQKWIDSGSLTLGSAGGDNSRWGILERIYSSILENDTVEDFGAYLDRKMRESRKDAGFFAAQAGMKEATLISWAKGQACPRVSMLPTVQKLGELLGCSDGLVSKLPHASRTLWQAKEVNPLMIALAEIIASRGMTPAEFSKETGEKNIFRFLRYGGLPKGEEIVRNWDKLLRSGTKLIEAYIEARKLHPLPTNLRVYSLRFVAWPKSLQDDWRCLEDYKTINIEGYPREEDAVWSQPGRGTCAMSLQGCESFFGWCVLNPEEGGNGMKLDQLNLGLIAVYKLFYAHARWLRTRNGRTTFNQKERVRVGFIVSLLRSESTFFFQLQERFIPHFGGAKNPETGLWSNLPTVLRAENPIGYGASFSRPMKAETETEQWVAFLYLELQKFRRFVKQEEFSKGSILTTKTGKWLVGADSVDIANWLATKWEEAFARIPPRSTSPNFWAIGVRNCLVLGFCIIRGFRRGTLWLLDTSMFPKSADGSQYEFAIPPSIFKARDFGGSKGGVYGPMPGSFALLHDLVKIYIEQARPLLLADSRKSFDARRSKMALVDAKPGLKMVADGADVRDDRTLKEAFFISQLGTRCSGNSINDFVIDLIDINIHGFRYLHATDGAKKGLSDEVIAQRLCNTPEMVRRMYNQTTAKHKNDSVNASLDVAFGKKSRTSDL